MKKAVLVLLLVALLLTSSQLVAVDHEFTNSFGDLTEVKTMIIQEELACRASENLATFVVDNLYVSGELPLLGTEQAYGYSQDLLQVNEEAESPTLIFPGFLKRMQTNEYRLQHILLGGDCFCGSIPNIVYTDKGV